MKFFLALLCPFILPAYAEVLELDHLNGDHCRQQLLLLTDEAPRDKGIAYTPTASPCLGRVPIDVFYLSQYNSSYRQIYGQLKSSWAHNKPTLIEAIRVEDNTVSLSQ